MYVGPCVNKNMVTQCALLPHGNHAGTPTLRDETREVSRFSGYRKRHEESL